MTLDGSTDPPATDAARTNEFARVGSENVGRAEAAKKTLELESERSEQRTASDLRIRATTEKLRMMIQSGRVTSNAGTPEEQIRDREICEAEKTQERPLVSQTLTVAAEQLRLQVQYCCTAQRNDVELRVWYCTASRGHEVYAQGLPTCCRSFDSNAFHQKHDVSFGAAIG